MSLKPFFTRVTVLATTILAIAACEGPTGPPGVNAQSHRFTTVLSNIGYGGVTLPAAAGTNHLSPPALLCYITQNPEEHTKWIIVSGSSTSWGSCELYFNNGTFSAVLQNSQPGWTAAFVVVY